MKKKGRFWRIVGYVVAGLFLLLLALAALGAWSNRGLSARPAAVDRLGELDRARLAEALHLKNELGEAIWPGWGAADIPVILYNEAYAFLIGLREPAPGWIKVPGSKVRGGPWEEMPGKTPAGTPYYRQPLTATGTTPEAFTVRVGERYVASAPTLDWLRTSLVRKFRNLLPPVIEDVFPYRLALRFLISGSEGYISIVLHESFHAYQGIVTPARLAAAEQITALESNYGSYESMMRAAWRDELSLLATAAASLSREDAARQARRFLSRRAERRASSGLAPDLLDYERKREWLEGLAKYVELEAWHAASAATNYRPLPDMARDPDFQGYSTFASKWSRELGQMNRMASDENRFYYSGMAQAVLLDRLMPGWKNRALSDGVWLEDLLNESLADRTAAAGHR